MMGNMYMMPGPSLDGELERIMQETCRRVREDLLLDEDL
jgi:hypothetical protein